MRIVIDTSIFSNPVTRNEFGEETSSAIERFIEISAKAGLEIFIPTSIFRELSNFASEESMTGLRKVSVIRGPDLLSMKFPAVIFHTFISDIRERINKGLRIAEEAIESSKTADNIRRIRNEYRAAMRSGIIDSVEDLDVVLLAKEIGGAVISADEGIAKMADSLGIEVFSAKDFKNKFAGGENYETGNTQ
jgi:hypothetical protein